MIKKSFIVIVATCSILSYWDAFGCSGGVFMKESWKDIIGYEGSYKVSNFGIIKSIDRLDTKNKAHAGKIISASFNKKGYMRVRLSFDNKEKTYAVHRLVAIHFVSNPENKPQVNHKDAVKSNNNYLNLEWVTNSENVRHAYLLGLNTGTLGKTWKRKRNDV